jgi:hypothetical protein
MSIVIALALLLAFVRFFDPGATGDLRHRHH